MTQQTKEKTIVIKSSTLDIGGVQSVIVSQVSILQEIGYRVIVVLDRKVVDYTLPKETRIKVLPESPKKKALAWKRILDESTVEAYFDHSILYNRDWVEYNAIAQQLGIRSIAWIHNAFVRPILDFSTQNIFLDKNIDIFDRVIVLSSEDANYYKLLGHNNVMFLPNPLPVAMDSETYDSRSISKEHRLELIWVGRAHQDTKRIFDLIPFMKELVRNSPQVHLSIVGPFTWDISEADYRKRIKDAGLGDYVSLVGPKTHSELIEYYENSDIAISTSIIEGFPISLIEASNFGLPIVMYELPWLWIAERNKGVTGVPQGDYASLAQAVIKISKNPELYRSMSQAAVEKIEELKSVDFLQLYDGLIKNSLSDKYSPKLDITKAANVVRLFNQFYGQIRDVKQNEILSLRADSETQQNLIKELKKDLSSYLGIKRSYLQLANNIKRKLRVRTRIKSSRPVKLIKKIYNKHRKIRVAVLVGEFFANDMPYCNGKGGYGVIARNYLAEYIPNKRISVETICGFSENDKLLTHIVDGRKKVLFLPANNPENQEKIRRVIDKYDVFLSIEFQDIANQVMQRASRNQKLIYYIQDPRPEEDWIELDSVSRFKAIGYRPDQQVRDLMNSLYSSNRLVPISQGRDFVDKARRLYALPESFSARFVPNAVDTPELRDKEIARKEDIVVSLARLDIVKRPWIIGEVARVMPEYKFVFAGQVHDKEMKKVMKPYLNLPNVINTGHIEQEEKDSLLRRSKLLINTSIHECIPVSFLEALSYGMLIVSNRNPDQITKKFGHPVEQVNGDGYEEVDEIVGAIRQLMKDDKFRTDTAKQAIDYVKKVHNIKRYTTSIREVITKAYNEQ